jgi:hypothetical protein
VETPMGLGRCEVAALASADSALGWIRSSPANTLPGGTPIALDVSAANPPNVCVINWRRVMCSESVEVASERNSLTLGMSNLEAETRTKARMSIIIVGRDGHRNEPPLDRGFGLPLLGSLQ